MSTFLCPYGCGCQFSDDHYKCGGEVLPLEQRIKLSERRFGGLSPEEQARATQVVPAGTAYLTGLQCPFCKAYRLTHDSCSEYLKEFGHKLPLEHQIKNGKRCGGGYHVVTSAEQLTCDWLLSLPSNAIVVYELPRVVLDNVRAQLEARHITLKIKGDGGERPQSRKGLIHFFQLGSRKVRLINSEAFGCKPADFERVIAILRSQTRALFDPLECWTIGQVAYKLWSETVKHLPLEPLTGEQYKFSNRAYYGARISCVRGSWKATTEELQYQVDCSSQYPSAMKKYQYPIGAARWVEGAVKGVVGLHEVTIRVPDGLKTGVLPTHRALGVGCDWPTSGTLKGVWSSVDLELAGRYGYEVLEWHRGLVWDAVADVFGAYITPLYELKKAATDPVARQTYKHLMNQLYGKVGETPKGVWQKVSDERLSELLAAGGDDRRWDMDEAGCYELSEPPENTKPNHLGLLCLAYTRVDFTEVLKVGGWEYPFIHTDALRLNAEQFARFSEAGLIDPVELGLFKLEYTLKGYEQLNANDYVLELADGTFKYKGRCKSRQAAQA